MLQASTAVEEQACGKGGDVQISPFMMHGLDVRQFLKEGRRMPDHNR